MSKRSDCDSKDGVHMSRLVFTFSLIAIFLAGCGSQQPSAAVYPVPGNGVAPLPLIQAPARSVAPPSSAEALSQTAAAYAQSMENQLDKRGVKPATDASPKAVERLTSNVTWLEPKDFSLRLGPPQSPEGPSKIADAVTTAN